MLPTGERHQARITYWVAADGLLHKGITGIVNGKPAPTTTLVLKKKG